MERIHRSVHRPNACRPRRKGEPMRTEKKSPRSNFALLPPRSPKFNVELAYGRQRGALRGTDRPSNHSDNSTLHFGGRGLLFCRTRSRQFLLCICFSRHDVAKTKAASQPKTKPTAQLHSLKGQRSQAQLHKTNANTNLSKLFDPA